MSKENEKEEGIKVEMDAEEKWADFFLVYGDPRAFTIIAGSGKYKISGDRKGREMHLRGEVPDEVRVHTILKLGLESAEALRNMLDAKIEEVKKSRDIK